MLDLFGLRIVTMRKKATFHVSQGQKKTEGANDSNRVESGHVTGAVDDNSCQHLADNGMKKYSLYQETDVYLFGSPLFKLLKFAGLFYNRYHPGCGKWLRKMKISLITEILNNERIKKTSEWIFIAFLYLCETSPNLRLDQTPGV